MHVYAKFIYARQSVASPSARQLVSYSSARQSVSCPSGRQSVSYPSACQSVSCSHGCSPFSEFIFILDSSNKFNSHF